MMRGIAKPTGILLALALGLGIVSGTSAQANCKVNDPDIAQSYVGDCVNGLAHGKGTAKGRDTYVGEFKNGLPDGQGTYTWADSVRNCGMRYCSKKYVGERKEGRRVCGKLDLWDGDSYEGCFEEDGFTMKGKTKFQLAEENRKYERTRNCQHIYVGRSVVYDKGAFGFLTGVVLGFSAQRGVATLVPDHRRDHREVLCTQIEE